MGWNVIKRKHPKGVEKHLGLCQKNREKPLHLGRHFNFLSTLLGKGTRSKEEVLKALGELPSFLDAYRHDLLKTEVLAQVGKIKEVFEDLKIIKKDVVYLYHI